MTNTKHDCTGCPVRAGTHKPADAVHTEIAEPGASGQQTEATKVSRMLRGMGLNSFITKQLDRAADLIDVQEADLSALRARCAAQQAELIKEAARTAEQKLRADQMSDQHETQAALNREARAKLAAGVPAAAPDARDAERRERWQAIGKAIERASADQPVGTEIVISLERGAGIVTMIDTDGDEFDNFPTDEGLPGVIHAAIDAAIAAQAGGEAA